MVKRLKLKGAQIAGKRLKASIQIGYVSAHLEILIYVDISYFRNFY